MNQASREAKRHEAECHEIERRVSERLNVERAVLGSMALLQEAAEFAAGALRGDEFTMQGRAMFRAMVAMTERGIPIDGVTLADELCKRGELEAAGGALFIFEVLEAVPHAEHCRHYVEQLQALRQRDELRRISERLNVRADDPTIEPSESIAGILNELEALRAGSVRKSDLITAGDALQAMEERAEDPAGIVATRSTTTRRDTWRATDRLRRASWHWQVCIDEPDCFERGKIPSGGLDCIPRNDTRRNCRTWVANNRAAAVRGIACLVF
jgi:hypothetical protein